MLGNKGTIMRVNIITYLYRMAQISVELKVFCEQLLISDSSNTHPSYIDQKHTAVNGAFQSQDNDIREVSNPFSIPQFTGSELRWDLLPEYRFNHSNSSKACIWLVSASKKFAMVFVI